MKKDLLILFALLLISIPSIKSLLLPGGYTSHDLTHHIVRQINMDKLLSEGQFPPRWSGDLNGGFGYPLFLFNYPTPAVLGELFHKTGFNFVESVKAVMTTSMLISVIGMYLLLISLFPKQRLAAFLGAIFYLYAPIRFINIYVSASVGAALALGILPFVFWSIVKTSQGKWWATPAGAALIALLITSHNVTALMFAPFILLFSLVMIYLAKGREKLTGSLIFMAILGLGLAAFFWIPAIAEKRFIVYDQIMGDSWVNQFPTISQLIHSPWGYGLAHPGINEPGAMSFQIGLAQILAIGALLITIVLFGEKKELTIWGGFSLSTFFIGVSLMLKASSPLWANLPLLYLVQFPFRFLSVAVFASAFSVTLLIKYLPFKKIVFVFLLVLVLYANRNHLNVNQRFDPGDNYYLTLQNQATSYNEHLPIWAYIPKAQSPGKLTILEGKGEVNVTKNNSAEVTAEIDLETDSVLRFNQFYFPGWGLTDGGVPIGFSYHNEGENKGLPVFSLGKGKHQFIAKFGETPDRKVADLTSIVSLIILLGSAFVLCQIDRKQNKPYNPAKYARNGGKPPAQTGNFKAER